MRGNLQRRRAALALAFFVVTACDRSGGNAGPEDTDDSQQGSLPSPNASILPEPMATAAEVSGDAGKQPQQVGIPADSAGRLIIKKPAPPPPKLPSVNKALPRDRLEVKDTVGITLKTLFTWSDVPKPAKVPEIDRKAVAAAIDKTRLTADVDLAYSGRMRVALSSAAFPLPAHTEFRAKSQLYGHAMVWPDSTRYRVLVPGTLRAVFAERRADVNPVTRGGVAKVGAGSALGLRTQKSSVSTPLGKVILEQAVVDGSGASGALLCRFLIDLVGAEPQTEACDQELIPLKASFEWTDGGNLGFEAVSMENRQAIPRSMLYVPPVSARFSPVSSPRRQRVCSTPQTTSRPCAPRRSLRTGHHPKARRVRGWSRSTEPTCCSTCCSTGSRLRGCLRAGNATSSAPSAAATTSAGETSSARRARRPPS